MGLASVHRIAHDHGGHVVLTSDHGARFAVLLPAVPAGPQRAARTPTSSRDRAPLSGRVLLVDDEESVLNFMRELLRTWGLEVEAVRQPRQALALLQADPGYDLLLTDQTMPGMTGIDLAHAALSYAPRTPVLLYTGYADLIDPEALRHAGVQRLLHKPVEPAELRAALTHCLSTPRT
jgi:CheY-like chemotaxis protein